MVALSDGRFDLLALTDLRAFAVVGIGYERLVWRVVDTAVGW
ncbi:hypothetical protein [Thiocapsa sp.]